MGQTVADADEDAWLLAAETALARRDHDWPGGLEALLHAEFAEVGASGRRWDRAGIVELLATDPPAALSLDDPRVERLGPDVRLVTYETVDPGPSGRHARRSSLWLRVDGSWRLRYHQGTLSSPNHQGTLSSPTG